MQLLKEISKFFGIEMSKEIRIQIERINKILRNKSFIIIMDDFAELGNSTIKILKKLGTLVIGASRGKIKRFEFDEFIELGPLEKEQSKELIMYMVNNEEAANLIYTKTFGLPKAIINLCNEYRILKRFGEIENRKDLHFFISKKKQVILKRINLLPLSAVVFVGYLLLVTKYLLFGIGSYKEGYIVAILGYLAIALRYTKNRR